MQYLVFSYKMWLFFKFKELLRKQNNKQPTGMVGKERLYRMKLAVSLGQQPTSAKLSRLGFFCQL